MHNSKQPQRIVVIGGGISGLSAAFYLYKKATEQGKEIQVTIVEANNQLGGKINTLHRDGFVIERGPDSFLARKQPIIDLALDLGIQHQLTGTNPAAKKTYILHRGRLHPMPQGLMLGIPTEIWPFAKTGLLSVAAKCRAMLDFVLPARQSLTDESIGDFLARRLGKQVMERVAEPLLAGIYAGNLRKLSLAATFPQFAAAERKFGSLIRGMRAGKGKTPVGAAHPEQLPADATTAFLTFRGGLVTMVRALERALADAGATFVCGAKVTSIATVASNVAAPYALALANGQTLEADTVIVTTPSFVTASLLERYVDVSVLRDMHNVSVANVVLAYDKQSFPNYPTDGSGFVIPHSEGTSITACTWTSTKWVHSSPQDKVLLRCYVGRRGDEQIVDLPDDQLIANVRTDIRNIMGLEATPLFVEITRLHQSMPQYAVGHVERTKALQAELAHNMPGVYVCGAAFDGVGLPDCIRQGREVATTVLDYTP